MLFFAHFLVFSKNIFKPIGCSVLDIQDIFTTKKLMGNVGCKGFSNIKKMEYIFLINFKVLSQ